MDVGKIEKVLNVCRGMTMTSFLGLQEKHEHLENLTKLEEILIPRCDSCFEVKKEKK